MNVSHTSKIQTAVSWSQSQGHKKVNRYSLLIFCSFFKYCHQKKKKKTHPNKQTNKQTKKQTAAGGFQRETS